MGSCKRHQGVNGVKVGIGPSRAMPYKGRHRHGSVGKTYSVEDLLAMPAEIKRHLVRLFIPPQTHQRRAIPAASKRG